MRMICTVCRFLQSNDSKTDICYRDNCGGKLEEWKEVCSECGKSRGIIDPCYDCQYPKNPTPKGRLIGL